MAAMDQGSNYTAEQQPHKNVISWAHLGYTHAIVKQLLSITLCVWSNPSRGFRGKLTLCSAALVATLGSSVLADPGFNWWSETSVRLSGHTKSWFRTTKTGALGSKGHMYEVDE